MAMQFPTLRATIRDPRNGVTYEVCAYRDLTRDEAIAAIRAFNSTKKKAPKRGSTIRIIATLGAQDS